MWLSEWGCSNPSALLVDEFMVRLKCDASAEDLIKPIRANLSNLCLAKVMQPDLDEVAQHFERTILDCLAVTLRPSKSTLQGAAQKAFTAEPGEAQLWAGRIYDCISHCVHKARSATSGKTLPKSV